MLFKDENDILVKSITLVRLKLRLKYISSLLSYFIIVIAEYKKHCIG